MLLGKTEEADNLLPLFVAPEEVVRRTVEDAPMRDGQLRRTGFQIMGLNAGVLILVAITLAIALETQALVLVAAPAAIFAFCMIAGALYRRFDLKIGRVAPVFRETSGAVILILASVSGVMTILWILTEMNYLLKIFITHEKLIP